MNAEKPASILIKLTRAQRKAMEPFHNYAFNTFCASKPGMIVAQIGQEDRDYMRVGFLENNVAKQFERKAVTKL